MGKFDELLTGFISDIKKWSTIKIKLIDRHCKPYRAYPTDSGLDLRARIEKAIFIRPLENKVIPVGIAIELRPGYEAQIRPRSGLSKLGISAAFGTVDNSYRGEIKVTLINTSSSTKAINPYERIAQLIIAPVTIPDIEYVDELSKTERGVNGHGSTGRM
jgi:dUTP pyrophosphatase